VARHAEPIWHTKITLIMKKKRSFYLDNFNKKVRMSECIMKHLFETPYTCMARHYSFFVFLGVRQFSAFKGEKIDKVTPIWHWEKRSKMCESWRFQVLQKYGDCWKTQ
jgi:hypothetical protein